MCDLRYLCLFTYGVVLFLCHQTLLETLIMIMLYLEKYLEYDRNGTRI